VKYVRHSVLSLPLALTFFLAPAAAQDSVFPGETWEYVVKDDLQTHGWSPEVLEKTTSFIRDESNTTGLVVVDRGRVVYQFGDIEELRHIPHSCLHSTCNTPLIISFRHLWTKEPVVAFKVKHSSSKVRPGPPFRSA